jgi:hypothetical protein
LAHNGGSLSTIWPKPFTAFPKAQRNSITGSKRPTVTGRTRNIPIARQQWIKKQQLAKPCLRWIKLQKCVIRQRFRQILRPCQPRETHAKPKAYPMRVFTLLCCLALPAQADMQTARDAFTNAQFEKAVENLIPAANSGNAEAEFLLGNIHTLGLGVPPNAIRGFEFYLRAAAKGHPAAQLRLSRAFETGKGTALNPIRALLWSDLAAIGRADGAQERSQNLRNTMTSQDIKIAEDLLQDYRTYLFPLESQ